MIERDIFGGAGLWKPKSFLIRFGLRLPDHNFSKGEEWLLLGQALWFKIDYFWERGRVQIGVRPVSPPTHCWFVFAFYNNNPMSPKYQSSVGTGSTWGISNSTSPLFLSGSSSTKGCILRCLSLNRMISSLILPMRDSLLFLHCIKQRRPTIKPITTADTTPYSMTFWNLESSGSLTKRP